MENLVDSVVVLLVVIFTIAISMLVVSGAIYLVRRASEYLTELLRRR
jgi:hypothetical protein